MGNLFAGEMPSFGTLMGGEEYPAWLAADFERMADTRDSLRRLAALGMIRLWEPTPERRKYLLDEATDGELVPPQLVVAWTRKNLDRETVDTLDMMASELGFEALQSLHLLTEIYPEGVHEDSEDPHLALAFKIREELESICFILRGIIPAAEWTDVHTLSVVRQLDAYARDNGVTARAMRPNGYSEEYLRAALRLDAGSWWLPLV